MKTAKRNRHSHNCMVVAFQIIMYSLSMTVYEIKHLSPNSIHVCYIQKNCGRFLQEFRLPPTINQAYHHDITKIFVESGAKHS